MNCALVNCWPLSRLRIAQQLQTVAVNEKNSGSQASSNCVPPFQTKDIVKITLRDHQILVGKLATLAAVLICC